MKPLNRDENGCTKISSQCVIWDGDNIPCLKLCKGDSISEVTFKLATQLCIVLKDLDISSYDLSCFNLQGCSPKDFIQLLQLIIDKICVIQGTKPPSPATGTGGIVIGVPPPVLGRTMDTQVNMSSCFYTVNPKTGDQVTTSSLADYVTLIGNMFCSLLAQQTMQTGTVANQATRIGSVEKTVATLLAAPPSLPSLTPVCVMPNASTKIDIVLGALEQQFCDLRIATGKPPDLFSGINGLPAGTDTALGTSGGTLSGISGWIPNVQNVGNAFANTLLIIRDLRSAITNIQKNCCPTPCNGLSVKLSATMPNTGQLILYFTGAIPQGLVECNIAGTVFSISDQSGHSINVTIPVAVNMNVAGGYPVTISNTPLTPADNFTITSDICFKDNTIGTTCKSSLTYVFVNTLTCPSIVYVPGLTTLAFSFPHSSGTKTYTVALYDSTGNTQIQAQIFPVTNPTTISGTFSALVAGTSYKARVFILSTNGLTTTCPLAVVTTLPNPCPAASGATAIITIP